MEECPVCGRTYGVTHTCLGPIATDTSVVRKWSAPEGSHLAYYFRQAFAIARLDEAAIVGASLNAKALGPGIIIWVVGQFLIFGSNFWLHHNPRLKVNWIAVLATAVVVVLVDALWMLAQYGLCHVLARSWFGARGTYVGVLRPLLLGSIVTWVAVVPYFGLIGAGLWAIAIMMFVFENVDRISRLKAFGLSAVIGFVFQGALLSLLAR